MNDMQQSPKRRISPRVAGGVGLLAAGAIVGGILAGSLTASAATTASAAPTASTAAAPPANAHGPNAVRAGETVVTGSNAAKLKAAALKAVPGGTVYRIETDADGAAYEAHMTKADGTEVTVKFDKNFNATGTEAGMGKGAPR
ncbi:MAG: hypothetical protein M3O55_10045 [Actinomycetota bacterium]|nr:hypothetical protein [Actinomycetota bacterium]